MTFVSEINQDLCKGDMYFRRAFYIQKKDTDKSSTDWKSLVSRHSIANAAGRETYPAPRGFTKEKKGMGTQISSDENRE